VLVGGTSQTINVERRWIAWARNNPTLKTLMEKITFLRLAKHPRKCMQTRQWQRYHWIAPTLTNSLLNRT